MHGTAGKLVYFLTIPLHPQYSEDHCFLSRENLVCLWVRVQSPSHQPTCSLTFSPVQLPSFYPHLWQVCTSREAGEINTLGGLPVPSLLGFSSIRFLSILTSLVTKWKNWLYSSCGLFLLRRCELWSPAVCLHSNIRQKCQTDLPLLCSGTSEWTLSQGLSPSWDLVLCVCLLDVIAILHR